MSLVPRSFRFNWWWGFALLIAAPALVLALLGLRAVRAERIERQQQTLEQHKQLLQLVDAALGSAFAGLEADLRRASANESSAGQMESELAGGVIFSYDHGGSLHFARERVYFSERPAQISARAEWPPAVEQLVEEAQRAEAQSHLVEALRAYHRVGDSEPRLLAWSELSIAHIRHQAGEAPAFGSIADSGWARSEGLTPTALPVAFMACTYAERFAGQERERFVPLLEQTLESLRNGRWWLGYDERRFYDQEIRRLLESTGAGGQLTEDTHLEELAAIERAARQSPPLRSEGPTRNYQRLGRGPFLTIWLPAREQDRWTGLALSEKSLSEIFGRVIAPLLSHETFGIAVRDTDGQVLWGDVKNVAHAEALRAVRGWELAFGGLPPAGWMDQRQLLWYGFILLLVIMLMAGLAMNARLVRREFDLGRMQNEFIAAVSHEFKSPLTSIRLLMERLTNERGLTSEATREYHTAIGRETERLERLVNRLLEAHQIQSGSRQYNFTPVSIVELATSAAKDMRPHADAKNINLRCQIEKNIPTLNLDEAAITDALENLIDNAIKYSPAGTHVDINVRSVDSEVWVDVRDEGIGIGDDELAHVFDKFYRGRRGDAHNVRGTGLGLTLVKATIEAHGGQVEVSSPPGQGSRFRLRLPIENRGSNDGTNPNSRR